MSTLLEHDYIGLAENLSMERSSEKIPSCASSTLSSEDEKSSSLNFKETELRLGLPGCKSPERKPATVVSLFGKDLQNGSLKNLVSGAKRGFSDAINGSSGKWVFSVSDGSEVEADLGKGATLFSPGGGNGGKPHPGLEIQANSLHASASAPAPVQTIEEVGITSQTAKPVLEKKPQVPTANEHLAAPAAKAQVVGWPPIRSFRKNSMACNCNATKNNDEGEGKDRCGCLYVKVSMDGAPYLRKIDLKTYNNYVELSCALEKMFSCFTIGQCSSRWLPGKDGLSESSLRDLLHGSEYALTYEDKDGDWMLVGDVPWEMFIDSCRRLRIMKGSEAIGLAPRVMEKSRSQN